MLPKHGRSLAAFFVMMSAGGMLNAAESSASEPTFLYARLAGESSAAAIDRLATIVFESNTANASVRINLSAGAHRVCLDRSGEFFTDLRLVDSEGTNIPIPTDDRGCAAVNVSAGVYNLSLLHKTDTAERMEVALVSFDSKSAPLLNQAGNPRKGYWAVAPLSSGGLGDNLPGRLKALPPQDGHRPIAADYSSSQMDADSLWQFGPDSSPLFSEPASVFHYEADTGNVSMGTQRPGISLQVVEEAQPSTFHLRLKQEGNTHDVDLGFTTALSSPSTLRSVGSSPHYRKPATFLLAFRFFPDSSQMDSLAEGEIAVFESPNYLGRAAVFSRNAQNLSTLRSSIANIDHSASSIRLGPGTGAVLYSEANYAGEATRIQVDTERLPNASTSSFRLVSLLPDLLANRRCANCNLEGMDLSGLDLSGVDFTGARLSTANLSGTNLREARLAGADLSKTTLSCTDFSGTDADHLNDLTRTNFTGVEIVPKDSCTTNFSYTRMIGDVLPPSRLTSVNLTGVRYERLPRATAPVQGPPLLNNGFPIGGYWAVQPDPAGDPQRRAGRLRAAPPFQNLYGDNPNDAYVIADYSSQSMDEYSLFAFPPDANTKGTVLAPGTFLNGSNYGENQFTAIFLTVGQGYTCDQFCIDVSYRIEMTDLGNYHFQFGYYSIWVNSGPFSPWSGGPGPANALLDGVGPAMTFRVMFRFFPQGYQVGSLNDGEVAIFQGAGFVGKTAVFVPDANAYNLDLLTSNAVTLPQTVQAVRLGNNTAVAWSACTPTCSGGTEWYGVVQDQDNLGEYAQIEHLLWVQRLDQAITNYVQSGAGFPPFPNPFQQRACTNCKLANATLENLGLQGWNFSGANFSGATLSNLTFDSTTQLANAKFDGATLTEVKFGNASLHAVDLSGATLTSSVMSAVTLDSTTKLGSAKLTCVDFSGTGPSSLRDLTQVDFTGVQWLTSQSCRNNLSYTKLSVKQIPPSIWKNFNLTGAVFVDLNPNLSSQTEPLDLSGVMLGGVSLQNVVLDYAVMTGADLTGTFFNNSSLQNANLSQALLYGARLVNVNLDGANLGGALLTKPPSGDGTAAKLNGAFLRNVNLSQSRLSGADFSNSSFYSTSPVGAGTCKPNAQGFTDDCATASGAVMDNTEFSGAYLYGTDFTDTTAQGVRFGNSFLTGANFAGAVMSTDTSGSDTGFSGAFLQGANLATTTFKNGVSLQGAFVDFSASNTIDMLLNGQHTSFPGYWNTGGEPVCAEMSYNGPTTVPVTGPNDTCPNGGSYPNGCGPANPDGSNLNWKSPADITQQASYQQNATYTNAPSNGQPFCAKDFKWKPFSLETSGAQQQNTPQ